MMRFFLACLLCLVLPAMGAEELWSLVPPKKGALPAVKAADWPLRDLDRFVLSGMESQKLSPNPDADLRSLVRRLSFDLTGLPPTRTEERIELEAFVDQLLASSHFGERWGRHWLDLARYAESNGRDRNVMFYHAWRYRDYVIAAFNADKPYNQFICEQIAGDLMEAKDQAQRDELLTATGFLALGAKAYEEQKQEIFRMDVIDEQIEATDRGEPRMSRARARCHDH